MFNSNELTLNQVQLMCWRCASAHTHTHTHTHTYIYISIYIYIYEGFQKSVKAYPDGKATAEHLGCVN